MVRCFTADLVSDKYGTTCQPGEVYRPAQYWWLLVTASYTHLVQPDSLRSCLESLRFVVTEELILCFHIVDLYCRKLQFRWWLELIITLFVNFSRIRLLDDRTNSCTNPHCTWYPRFMVNRKCGQSVPVKIRVAGSSCYL